jgi:hypothetical protein
MDDMGSRTQELMTTLRSRSTSGNCRSGSETITQRRNLQEKLSAIQARHTPVSGKKPGSIDEQFMTKVIEIIEKHLGRGIQY